MIASFRVALLAIISLFLLSIDTIAQQLQITAHRGNSIEFPENTILAIENAIAQKFEWAELDVYVTKDNKLVVIHDASTGRVGDINKVVSENTYAALQEVDVAHQFRTANNISIKRLPAQRIPLLEDVLKLFQTSEYTKVSIQPKVDCVAEAVALVEKLGLVSKTAFNDGNLAYMKKVKTLNPSIKVFWDRPANSDFKKDLKTAKSLQFEALVLHHSALTKEKIDLAKRANIEIGAWTVNDTERLRELVQQKVDVIYTDEPRKLALIRKDPKVLFSEGAYSSHLQGIDIDNHGNVYWSWTDKIVKTDQFGKIIKEVPADNHQGDLCIVNDTLFVAVNLGPFNSPKKDANSWIYKFNPTTLELLEKVKMPELVYGAGGITFKDGFFYVVGGLPENEKDNTIYVYNKDLTFKEAIRINSGYTYLGIQTIAYGNGSWWLGIYDPKGDFTLQYSPDWKLEKRHPVQMSLGVAFQKDGTHIIGNNFRHALGKHYGYLRVYKD